MGITSMTSVQAQDIASLQDQEKLKRLGDQLGEGQDREKKLKEAAQGFESIFMGKIWERMRATVPKDDYLHSKEEEFYLSMFDRELSQKMADAGGIGLGKMLYDSLKDRLTEASHNAVSLKPLGSEAAPLNPLPARSRSEAEPSFPSSPGRDFGTMRELEQLIQKIEQEHGSEKGESKFTRDV
jgi:Rod binding domain-containing protein